MLPWISDSSTGFQLFLWGCALFGSGFFLLRVVMILLGGGFEDLDIGDLDADPEIGEHSAAHTEASFHLVSFNSIVAFIMMFGWSGLTANIQFGLSFILSLLIASFCGFVMMVITAYMFYMLFKLVSEGADFNIKDVVGHTGTVYEKIPASGTGVVHITLNGMLRELDAVSVSGDDIDSFASVTVSKLLDENIICVEETHTAKGEN